METSECSTVSVLQVANELGYSPRHLQRLCKQETGYSVGGLIRIRKMHTARQLLENRSMSVKEVARMVGYKNQSHFASAFKDTYGCNPSRLNHSYQLTDSVCPG
ncbi:helix-turn-helix transcriptional regulator [Effusibacillus lacus]|uniref:helix-turn-helix transcriptional regulator n=1 Tax=Effusibacillus lacus TaxID=1348429 RepID=UPI001405571C|nr:helix-turn-helix transcriptional regulator [Effusibacillus lacus]